MSFLLFIKYLTLVPLASSALIAKTAPDHLHERESQDSEPLVHKSAPPQFTARGAQTDLSTHVRGGTPDHLPNPGSISQISSQTIVHFAQSNFDDRNTNENMEELGQVLGTTKDELECNDTKDLERGTSNEVV